MQPSQTISQTYTGTTTQFGHPYEVTKNPLLQTPHSKELYTPWQLDDKRQGESRSVCQLPSWCLLSTWSRAGPGHRTGFGQTCPSTKLHTSLNDASTNTGDQKAENTKSSWRRTRYDSNAQGVTERRSHLPPPHLQRNYQNQLLATGLQTRSNHYATQTWLKSEGHFVIPHHYFTTNYLKGVRKAAYFSHNQRCRPPTLDSLSSVRVPKSPFHHTAVPPDYRRHT